MSFILSPNMSLPVPTVGTEAGPQYAFDVNSSLTLIDSHDHTPGKGVQITPSAININTSLPFNDNPAMALQYVSFIAQTGPSATIQSLSVAPAGSPVIDELWYTDNNGTQTQLTKNGNINVVVASIPGESYSAGTFIWDQTPSLLPTTPANFDIGSITIRPNIAATMFGTQIVPFSGISSTNTFTLPNVNIQMPVSLGSVTTFLSMTSTGQISPSAALTGIVGQYLGTASGPTLQWTSFKPATVQSFTSGSGTYMTPAGCLYIKVKMVGGGGGGSGSGSGTPTGQTAGTNSTFGANLIAGGGSHGTWGLQSGGGAGGNGGTATISGGLIGVAASGGDGSGATWQNNSTNQSIIGGAGGASALGGNGGAGGFFNIGATGTAGTSGKTNTGGGGGGGGGQTGLNIAGGTGGGAGGYVECIISSPATSYSYAVGSGGTNGSAGTSGSDGGAGGSGVIVVEEYYQ